MQKVTLLQLSDPRGVFSTILSAANSFTTYQIQPVADVKDFGSDKDNLNFHRLIESKTNRAKLLRILINAIMRISCCNAIRREIAEIVTG